MRTPELTTQISRMLKSPANLIKKEEVAQRKVEVATYRLYVKAAGYSLSVANHRLLRLQHDHADSEIVLAETGKNSVFPAKIFDSRCARSAGIRGSRLLLCRPPRARLCEPTCVEKPARTADPQPDALSDVVPRHHTPGTHSESVAFTLIVIIISTPLFAVVILPFALIYLVFLVGKN
ncbi:unnamed protein product [Caenorhabditis sp. 36 PRJEB53466]|nr:unnamed protein product [Caenorhabditis sp. 36 PRJEB53466]